MFESELQKSSTEVIQAKLKVKQFNLKKMCYFLLNAVDLPVVIESITTEPKKGFFQRNKLYRTRGVNFVKTPKFSYLML